VALINPETARPRSVREQTDESLRVEREKADQALGDQLAAIDEAADAVISLARTRADGVLAAARARIDEQARSTAAAATSPKIVAKERTLADEALRQERAVADDVLREERAEHLDVLSNRREETDKDLSSERARSDNVLATRDEFLGIVSHDLRHMLNAMVGSASLISKDVLQDNHTESVAKHAERIQRAGARMNRLIGDLADVVSIEAGRLAVSRELGDPTSVVTEAVDTFQALAAASRVSLHAEVVAPMAPTPFDTARILQVLTNLLSNAIKFTPAGGTVVVRVEGSGDDILFCVSDTGVGIAPDQLEAVFVRFLQLTKADRRGIGLGLYISKCIVQGHGGRIWAEARPGGGSVFKFTLPIQQR
jgi:signal transduction histidine kinase